MTDSPQPPAADQFGRGPLPPPPPAGRAGRLIAGALLIIVGSVLALPAGFCAGLVVTTGDIGVMGLGLVAAAVAALGGWIIWAGCRLILKDRPAGPLFSGIIILLIILAFILLVSMANARL